MDTNILCFFLIWSLVIACNSKQEEATSDLLIDSNIAVLSEDSVTPHSFENSDNEYLKPQEIRIDEYTFQCGYEKYNEDSFGFSNPGFLKVIKNGNEIFKDTFEGEGEVYIKSLGHHELSGDKLVFALKWGTEACDYNQYSKYYMITPKDKVYYLKECWSGSGGDGYATRYYLPIFPEDSLGKRDELLIVEGIVFHEKDQPDRSDTTYMYFNGDTYEINKPTNNMDKTK